VKYARDPIYYNVIGFLGETKGGEPFPLKEVAEVNRMLVKGR